MLIEEIFGTDIPDRDAEGLGTQVEIVDWLESHLSNRRPNKRAAARLRTLAKAHNSPELAEGNVAARADRSYRARHLSRVKEPECNQLFSTVIIRSMSEQPRFDYGETVQVTGKKNKDRMGLIVGIHEQ